MEVLIFWLALAAIVGVIGIKRGFSFWSWFLRSVFSSPLIAGIWVVAKRPDTKQLEQAALREGAQRKCPACAELVKAEARKCRFCGEALVAVGAIGSLPVAANPPEPAVPSADRVVGVATEASASPEPQGSTFSENALAILLCLVLPAVVIVGILAIPTKAPEAGQLDAAPTAAAAENVMDPDLREYVNWFTGTASPMVIKAHTGLRDATLPKTWGLRSPEFKAWAATIRRVASEFGTAEAELRGRKHVPEKAKLIHDHSLRVADDCAFIRVQILESADKENLDAFGRALSRSQESANRLVREGPNLLQTLRQ